MSYDDHNSLLDTSSVFAHDVAGKLHVIQFCLEELSPSINENQSVLFDKIKSNSRLLLDVVTNFREFLKESFFSAEGKTLVELIELSKHLLKVHSFGRDTKFEINLDLGAYSDVTICNLSFLNCFYSFLMKNLRKAYLEKIDTVVIEVKVSVEGEYIKVVPTSNLNLTEEEFFGTNDELEFPCEKNNFRLKLGLYRVKENFTGPKVDFNIHFSGTGPVFLLKSNLKR